MRTFVALLRRSARRHAGLIAALCTVLSAFQVLLVVVARNYLREGLFGQLAALMPPLVQEVFGGADVSTFRGMIALGFFHPVVMLALSIGAIVIASEPAGEIEHGLVDIVLARPVPRHLVITRSAVVSGGAMAAIILVLIAANRLAVAWIVPPGSAAPSTGALLRIGVNLLAVLWCFSAAALAVAAHARRRAVAAGTVGLAAVVLYLFQYAAAAWTPARPYARISPFHYYQAMPTLMGLHDPGADVLVLLAATAALLGVAYLRYAHRDL